VAERRDDFDEAAHPIWAVMAARNLTRRQVATMLDLSQGYCDQVLYRWRRPSVDLMVKIRDLFGISMDEQAAVPLRPPPGARRGRRRPR
jgi:hypothetical protein